jgi:hypothetical protein
MGVVGGPHLSRKLKPTVTIRGWSPQNMTRVRFTRKVQDYALARCGGKGQLLVKFARAAPIGWDGSLFLIASVLPPMAHSSMAGVQPLPRLDHAPVRVCAACRRYVGERRGYSRLEEQIADLDAKNQPAGPYRHRLGRAASRPRAARG